jgi:hypothetical protein
MVAAGVTRPRATGARCDGESEIDMAQVRNIQGQSSYVDGVATGEVFVDFGEIEHNRYVRIRVQPDEDGMIVLAIDGEMCAGFNDAPSMRIVVNGTEILDTSRMGGTAPQPEDPWMPPRD